MNVTTTINIPSAAAYFEGHFPGRPILPGVVEVALALKALAHESSDKLSLQAISYMRLRQIVLPGDRLELTTKVAERGYLRIELKRDGTLVANGEWLPGLPAPWSERGLPVPDKSSPLPDIPPLDALLPHRPPMRFVQSILSEKADSLTCMATIPSASTLAGSDGAPAVIGLEVAAQAAAAWEALQRWREEGAAAPCIGYLVALREVVFFVERIPADQALSVIVKLDMALPPLSHYLVELYLKGRLLVRGKIATFLKKDGE